MPPRRQTESAATQADLKVLPRKQTWRYCHPDNLEDADIGADKAIVVGEGAAKDGNGNDEATATSEGEATSTEGSAEG